MQLTRKTLDFDTQYDIINAMIDSRLELRSHMSIPVFSLESALYYRWGRQGGHSTSISQLAGQYRMFRIDCSRGLVERILEDMRTRTPDERIDVVVIEDALCVNKLPTNVQLSVLSQAFPKAKLLAFIG